VSGQEQASTEITALLGKVRDGDAAAIQRVFEAVYPELKRLAAARMRAAAGDPSLSPTELVHEAFLRLVGAHRLELEDRRHFFACAARAMRLIVIDHARRSSAQKRGGELVRITWNEELPLAGTLGPQVLDLDRALDELAEVNPRGREVVDFRFFAGLTAAETAELMELSLRTVNREWQKARSFLYAWMQP
jgi:RNA polymerase sigma factor (TIGR02999 family)